MGLPKNFRKNISILPQHIGQERRNDMIRNDIAGKGTYLPRGVMIEDMDKSFIDFVEKDLSVTIDGEKVAVIFLTIQRWAEYSRTWKFTDEYKNIKIPFVTIVRKANPQVGTNQGGLWNIPGRPTWTYMKVPTFNGGREGVDLYKIPQPTAIDLNYDVRVFCNKMRDLNKFSSKILQIFQSRQFYINPNGHPMPIYLETIGDESQIDDLQNRRFYVQNFEMRLSGYILNEEDFKVVPTADRMVITTELPPEKCKPSVNVDVVEKNNTITMTFISRVGSGMDFSIVSEYDIEILTLNKIYNINSVVIKLDGVYQPTFPFNVNAGQTLKFTINKSPILDGKFIMIGNILK